jgi:hypothetical protein
MLPAVFSTVREGRSPIFLPETAFCRYDGSNKKTPVKLVLFFPDLLAIALPRQRFLDSLLLAWFQVEGVALDLFDNVLGLYLALETAQSILERLAFLYTNFCQVKYTSKPA